MRVVLDTNVFLVSLLKTSKYRPIFDALIKGRFTLVISHEIFQEYTEIIGQKTTEQIAGNVTELILSLENVEKTEVYYKWQLIEKDRDDNKFVDCAIAGNVKYIVTNDKHFNILSKIDFPKVDVVRADDFLEELEKLIP